jgi:hypothetical protein
MFQNCPTREVLSRISVIPRAFERIRAYEKFTDSADQTFVINDLNLTLDQLQYFGLRRHSRSKSSYSI